MEEEHEVWGSASGTLLVLKAQQIPAWHIPRPVLQNTSPIPGLSPPLL